MITIEEGRKSINISKNLDENSSVNSHKLSMNLVEVNVSKS